MVTRRKKFNLPSIPSLAKLPERDRENKINEILEHTKKKFGSEDTPYVLSVKKIFINDGYKGFSLSREEIAEELKKIEATKDNWKVKSFKTISTPKGFKK
tara:strand:+ start:552 stop:851 length:300 start_codon:yes stop_codon:yes gene_type:complete